MRNNLNQILKERQIGHEPFARMTGISVSTVKRWCDNNVTRYDDRIIRAFCDQLKITVSELINIEDIPL